MAVHKGVPVLYAKGTNYQVGLAIGRTFKGFFQDFVERSKYLNKDLLPLYEKPEVKDMYRKTLHLCEDLYANYVQELRGMAEGSGIPFEKIFLINLDFLPELKPKSDEDLIRGCTDLLCNKDEILLGHTEDCEPALVNNLFIVHAEIVNDAGELMEKWSSLTYPCYLSGYTMGFNPKGMVHGLNTLCPPPQMKGIPTNFACRAILNCGDLQSVLRTLEGEPFSITTGFALNVYFARTGEMYSLEVLPSEGKTKIDVHRVEKGETYAHCNKYLRMDVTEDPIHMESSIHRMDAIKRLGPPDSLDKFRTILSNTDDIELPIFREYTGLVGIFDIGKKTWSIYTDKPLTSTPVAVIPMDF